jgi:hypothetical protein
MTCLIAMQKVEGSNPFSRFFLQINTFRRAMSPSAGRFRFAFWALNARTAFAFFNVFGHWCPKMDNGEIGVDFGGAFSSHAVGPGFEFFGRFAASRPWFSLS